MKEKDYIHATHLARVLAARRILHDVCPSIDEHVPDDEMAVILRTLDKWAEALFGVCKTVE